MRSYSTIITSGEVVVAGEQILKMAVSRFVDASEEKVVSQQIFTTVMTRTVVDKRFFLFTTASKITKAIFINSCSQLKTLTPT